MVANEIGTGPSESINRLKRCRHGLMLYNVNDLHIGRSLDLYGEWAEAELALLGLFLQPGDVVVDVGANIGTHTVFFATRVGPTGRVVAFEPQRIVFQMLCANAALNDLSNVHALHAGAAAAEGTMRVPDVDFHTGGNYGGVALAGGASGEPVRVTTLDQLSLDRCKIIKVDVEGMERDVLEGGRELISSARPILFVENNQPARSPALITWLLEHDYQLFWYFSRFFNPDNFARNADNVFGKVGDVNMIGVRPERADALRAFAPVAGPDDSWEALQRRLGHR
jgi:FkbM family methyltransferase